MSSAGGHSSGVRHNLVVPRRIRSSDNRRFTIAGHSNGNPGRSVWETSTAFEQPPHDTAWNLDDIRSSFAIDITHYVRREGNDPIASGSYGDIYRGTFRVRGRSIDVAVKAIRTYSADDGDYPRKQKRLRREIKVWLNLNHVNIVPLFGTTMDFGRFPAMVCPWLANGQLSSYLERCDNTLTMGERLTLLNDVAVGLQYCKDRCFNHSRQLDHTKYHT
ncbi:kinase-like domain-containing protein [Melanogaster broomeanus]|nr:kinase-like domain-containing protein [Melanogaster broomeanus]